MKRILVCVMSCNDDFFEHQVQKIKDTWAVDIVNNKYDNIDFLYYKGGDKFEYNEKKCELVVRCEDDLDNTFKKTIYAFAWITENLKQYDYIFRTNTSTYINIKLLNAFVQSLDDENIVYTSELYSLIESNCPKPLYLYGRGNGLLFSKKMVDILITESLNLLYMNVVDDSAIGNVLNSYWIKRGKNYLDYIKSYLHGWFKAVENTNYVGGKPSFIRCTFDNKNTDFNFLKQFISIQTKMYYSRELEDKNYDELHEIIYNNSDDDIENTININKEYSNNPNIFLGSILGYMQYSSWLKYDKNLLFRIQADNKASNDIYKNKFINKPFY